MVDSFWESRNFIVKWYNEGSPYFNFVEDRCQFLEKLGFLKYFPITIDLVMSRVYLFSLKNYERACKININGRNICFSGLSLLNPQIQNLAQDSGAGRNEISRKIMPLRGPT